MKSKCAAEFLGTFVLVFAGTGSAIVNDHSHGAVSLVGIALTFALAVMVIIYSVGDVSGAHINPAVSVGLLLAGRFPARCVLPYVVSQLGGAVLASLLLRFLFPANSVHLGATLPSGTVSQSFILEVVLTALLMFVILCVTTGSKETGELAGLAIAGVVALCIMMGGPISGASMNPARSFGPALVSGHLSQLWIYLTAPFIGSAAGIGFWRLIRGS